tara:strand:+ start:7365 stop:8405 length:1041 start_codon:yes stop_codon:yes gene_type:complete
MSRKISYGPDDIIRLIFLSYKPILVFLIISIPLFFYIFDKFTKNKFYSYTEFSFTNNVTIINDEHNRIVDFVNSTSLTDSSKISFQDIFYSTLFNNIKNELTLLENEGREYNLESVEISSTDIGENTFVQKMTQDKKFLLFSFVILSNENKNKISDILESIFKKSIYEVSYKYLEQKVIGNLDKLINDLEFSVNNYNKLTDEINTNKIKLIENISDELMAYLGKNIDCTDYENAKKENIKLYCYFLQKIMISKNITNHDVFNSEGNFKDSYKKIISYEYNISLLKKAKDKYSKMLNDDNLFFLEIEKKSLKKQNLENYLKFFIIYLILLIFFIIIIIFLNRKKLRQ